MLYTLNHALYVFTRSVTTPSSETQAGELEAIQRSKIPRSNGIERWQSGLLCVSGCNSLGIVIPKEEATKKGLREVDEVEVVMRKASDIRELFGKYEFRDLQKLK